MDDSPALPTDWALGNPIEVAIRRSAEGKDITSFFPGSEGSVFLIHSPALVREMLVGKPSLFAEEQHPYINLSHILCDTGKASLLLGCSDGAKPNGQWLESICEYIVGETSRLCNGLIGGLAPDAPSVDLSPALATLLLRIMGKLLFDLDLRDLSERFHEASVAHEQFLALSRRGNPDVRRSDALRHMGDAAMSTQDEIIEALSEQRFGAEEWRQVKVRTQLPKGMSVARAMVRTLLNAYAGTATTLSWLMCVLADHPQIQNELATEVQHRLGSRRASLGDIDAFPLARMVVSETMRLYPTAWMISRTARSETSLANTLIPRGAKMFVCVYTLHRNPRYWKDAEQFIPARFQNDELGRAVPYSYIPFGAGTHRCPGAQLAITTLRLICMTLIQEFSLGKATDVTITPFPHVALRPTPGAFVKVTKRECCTKV